MTVPVGGAPHGSGGQQSVPLGGPSVPGASQIGERPPGLADVTELLVRAQSGAAQAVLDELDGLFGQARREHAHERMQWLRFVRFVALHELRILSSADEVAAEMIRVAEPYDDRVWEALGRALRGMSALLQGHVEGGYDELARAVVLLEDVQDHDGYAVGHAINAAALALGRLDLYELAAAWWERMGAIAEELGDRMLQTLYAFNSVWLHLTWAFELDLIGEPEAARGHYRRALQASEKAATADAVRDSAWPSEVMVQSFAARAMLGERLGDRPEFEVDLRKHLEIVQPTQRQEATLTGHLALARVYANSGDATRALEEAELACAAGDTAPRLPVSSARAYAEYASLLREHGGDSPATAAYTRLSERLLRDRWEERRARVLSFEERLEHERVRDELRRRAAAYLTDPLTGLGNRRLIEIRLPELLVESAAAGHALAVAFVDIDDFKSVNDDISHLAGDDLLRELSQEMRSGLRSDDVVARFGGEEFVLVLPNRGGAAAHRETDEMRRRIERRVWRCLPADRRITVTVGLAESWDGASRTQMLAAADEALLSAKRAGKNRVEVHARPG